MVATPRQAIEQLFTAVEAKDLNAALRAFTDDAVLIDPHYPTPRMAGKAAMASGLRWAFGTINTFGFRIVAYFASEDGRSGVVEVATSHVLRGGMKLNFPQVFVIETRDELITRLQAYEPYGPNGIGGIILVLTRAWRNLRGQQ